MKNQGKLAGYIRAFYIGVAVVGIITLTIHNGVWKHDTTQEDVAGGAGAGSGQTVAEYTNNEQLSQSIDTSQTTSQVMNQTNQNTASETDQSNASESATDQVDGTGELTDSEISEITEITEETENTEAAEDGSEQEEADAATGSEDWSEETDTTAATEAVQNLKSLNQQGVQYSVTIGGASYVHVRETAVSKSKSVGILSKGATGTLLEGGQYCSLVRVNGLTGYVYNKYLIIESR